MISINKKNKKKGFTLIEMLIGVLIFSISMVALMNISSRGLKVSRGAEKQVIADYLAIEAIEVVRNMRDSAFLRGLGNNTWNLVFQGGDSIFANDGCFNGNGRCNFHIPSGGDPQLSVCHAGCPVYVNKNNFYYFQTEHDSQGGSILTPSGFTRSIKINEVNNGQIFVLVKVSWDGGSVEYTENLFLWQ